MMDESREESLFNGVIYDFGSAPAPQSSLLSSSSSAMGAPTAQSVLADMKHQHQQQSYYQQSSKPFPESLDSAKDEPQIFHESLPQWFQHFVNLRILKAIACHVMYCFLVYFISVHILYFSFLHPIRSLFDSFSLFLSLPCVTFGLLFTIFGILYASLFGFFVLRFETDDRLSYRSVRSWLIYFASLNIALSQSVFLSYGAKLSELSRFFIYLLIIAHIAAKFYDIFCTNHRLIFPIIEMRPYMQFDYVVMPAARNVLRKNLPQIMKWILLLMLICGLPTFGWSFFRNLFSFHVYFNILILLLVQLFLHQIAVGLIKIFVLQNYTFPMPLSHATLDSTPDQQRSLMNALESSGVVKAFAFWDLRTICAACYRRRQIIFSLSQPGGHPRNWDNVRLACLKQIQWLNQRFEIENERIRRATFAALTPSLVAQSTENQTGEGDRPAILLQSIWQKGIVRQRINARDLKKNDSNLYSKSLSDKLLPSFLDKIKSVLHTQQPIISLFDVYIGILAIESLTALVCASLNEDRFGVVQKDLHTIVSILLQICNNLQKYMRSTKVDKEWQSKTCVPLITSANLALSRIRVTFPEGSISKRLNAHDANCFEKVTSLE